MKKSELSYEQITLLILFLMSLVFVFGLLKYILIPFVGEKTKQQVCRIALVKSQSNSVLSNLIQFSSDFACNDIETKDLIVDSDYDVLENLLIYLKKSCDIVKSGITNLNTKDKVCFYTLRLRSTKTIDLDCNLIKKLVTATIPTEKKPFYEYCNNPDLIVNCNELKIEPGKDLLIKICYSKKEGENSKFYVET